VFPAEVNQEVHTTIPARGHPHFGTGLVLLVFVVVVVLIVVVVVVVVVVATAVLSKAGVAMRVRFARDPVHAQKGKHFDSSAARPRHDPDKSAEPGSEFDLEGM